MFLYINQSRDITENQNQILIGSVDFENQLILQEKKREQNIYSEALIQ